MEAIRILSQSSRSALAIRCGVVTQEPMPQEFNMSSTIKKTCVERTTQQGSSK